ncbi:MAG: HU family DNA-binding protein [Gammaproteobacteria bacterium]|jgi:nucleoid DNA-binding protein|nr:HU family DNA-binding protein [Gammaproteobacteria bacterium]NNJ49043.1 DNA-binding protein [Gammaproteobacteria bacterium]
MVPAKKKAVKKKAVKKKAVKKKAVAPAKKIKAIKDAYTKSALYAHISEDTGLARKDVAKVFDSLNEVIEGHIKSRGAGEFKVPGLMKIKVNKKPATKARKGVPNPFRPGELMDVAAKPARKVVKVLPLKALKDMAAS